MYVCPGCQRCLPPFKVKSPPPCGLCGGVCEWKVMPPLPLWYVGWGVGVEGEGLRLRFAWHVENSFLINKLCF